MNNALLEAILSGANPDRKKGKFFFNPRYKEIPHSLISNKPSMGGSLGVVSPGLVDTAPAYSGTTVPKAESPINKTVMGGPLGVISPPNVNPSPDYNTPSIGGALGVISPPNMGADLTYVDPLQTVPTPSIGGSLGTISPPKLGPALAYTKLPIRR